MGPGDGSSSSCFHVGRHCRNPAFQEGPALPVGASAVAGRSSHRTLRRDVLIYPPAVHSRSPRLAGIAGQFRARPPKGALAARFDGVEVARPPTGTC